MSDTISRQAVINAINALHEKPNAWLDSAVDAVMALPSAIIMCKECKFCHKEDEYELWCNGLGAPARLVRPNDYCSRGARMKGIDDIRNYEAAVEQMEHNILYEPTYNPDDGSM